MDDGGPPTNGWRNTKKAVERFRRLLLCSKCSHLMKEPVCLGTCEHMLCRSCAGPRAGDGCVVCHSHAWVKDIQINRQLSSIIQLFCGLESLLKPAEQPGPSPETEGTVFKHKKNFKIWFSPRSRKVRCVVEKPAEVTTPDSTRPAPSESGTTTDQNTDLTVFNFTSSSPDSCSSSQRCSTGNNNRHKKLGANGKARVQSAAQKQTTQKMKRTSIEAINQQWEKEQPCAEAASRSGSRVSFVNPADIPDEPQGSVHKARSSSLSEGRATVLKNPTQLYEHNSDSVTQSDTLSADDPAPIGDPDKQAHVSPTRHTAKRSRPEEKVSTAETTPKRPRPSAGRRRKPLCHTSPSVLNTPPPLTSPRRDKNMKTPRDQRASPCGQNITGGKSPSPHASVGRSPSWSPVVVKKNHKGESLLHLAAIKGDVESVKDLLDQGADPNLKDNAGWTPLHEACNLGHLAVVEVLLLKGALLNTPGYENDSPLHDAVRNGHTAIAKVLLQLGASRNVLNMYGKRPADYATTLEMLEVFQEASDKIQSANTSLNPSASLSVVSDCVQRGDIVMFLSSKLSQKERQQISRLVELLDGKIADTFSGSVSHVVVPEGPTPTTYSTLLGLLAGCWIVKYSWVEACLSVGEWMPENEHEAGEGPQRSRINRCSLMPPKDEVAKLLREGGGQLLSRQPKPDSDVTQTVSAAAYHALPGSDQALCTHYIIFDAQGRHKPALVRRGKVWSAPSTWLIDCIAAFRLLPVPAV